MSDHPRAQGFAALRRGDPAGALSHFRMALKADGNDVAALKGSCQAARALHLWDELQRALQRLLTASRDRSDLFAGHLARAHVLDVHLDRGFEARTHYERALMIDPSAVFPYLALAELDLRSGTWSRAIAHADHGLESCPPDGLERALLWVCKAVAMDRVSLSMGPVSVFFRGLGGTPGDAEPAIQALEQAALGLPALATRDLSAWVSDPDALMALVRQDLPRPAAPTWWFADGT